MHGVSFTAQGFLFCAYCALTPLALFYFWNSFTIEFTTKRHTEDRRGKWSNAQRLLLVANAADGNHIVLIRAGEGNTQRFFQYHPVHSEFFLQLDEVGQRKCIPPLSRLCFSLPA